MDELPRFRNARFVSQAGNVIALEVQPAPGGDWIPFTAIDGGTGLLGALHAAALDASPAAYVDRDPDGAQALAEERQEMRVYRRAFNAELERRPVADSPVLLKQFPDAQHFRAALDQFGANLPDYHPFSTGWADIVQPIRTHADMEAWREFFEITPEWLDDVFRNAIAAERQKMNEDIV